ncbi:MAG: hypothetical protein ACRDCT_07035, partial [Shewanella sp.]
STFMKNSKKFYKHPKTSRPYFPSSEEAASTESHGENSSIVESTPAIAIVAPTARNPVNHAVNLSNSITPCKAHAAPRTLHHIHHIQPVQITAPTTPANLTQPQVWPVVEPAFHFGPGFEVHQSYCPTHSRQHTDQHIVMFYLSPGVAASFQIAGGHKILQGESLFTFLCCVTMNSSENVHRISAGFKVFCDLWVVGILGTGIFKVFNRPGFYLAQASAIFRPLIGLNFCPAFLERPGFYLI